MDEKVAGSPGAGSADPFESPTTRDPVGAALREIAQQYEAEIAGSMQRVREGAAGIRDCMQVYALRSAIDKISKAVKAVETVGKQVLKDHMLEEQQLKVRLSTFVGDRTASLRPYRMAWVKKDDMFAFKEWIGAQSGLEPDALGLVLQTKEEVDKVALYDLVTKLRDEGQEIPDFISTDEGSNVGFTGR